MYEKEGKKKKTQRAKKRINKLSRKYKDAKVAAYTTKDAGKYKRQTRKASRIKKRAKKIYRKKLK